MPGPEESAPDAQCRATTAPTPADPPRVTSASQPTVISAPPPPPDAGSTTAQSTLQASIPHTDTLVSADGRTQTGGLAGAVQDTGAKVRVGNNNEWAVARAVGEPKRAMVHGDGDARLAAVTAAPPPPQPSTPTAPPSSAPPSVTPEDLARGLGSFRTGAPTPAQTNAAAVQPEEEEWMLKSIAWPPLPPTPFQASASEAASSCGFETDSRLRVRIICQNANGPCSLIALCNILILRNDLIIAPGRTSVAYSHLSNLLVDYFLRATSSGTSPQNPGTELSLEAVLSILPQTRYGLNLNPCFDRIDGFAASSPSKGELALFSLARIPLLHGWLADPAAPETYEALVGEGGCGDYDKALECVVEGAEIAGGAGRLELTEEDLSDEEMLREAERRSRWTEEEERKVRRAYLINAFLSVTSTQLTYPGLSALCTTPSLLPPAGLAALFRNSHLSVLYRRPSLPSSSTARATGPELFTLVTDAAFAGEEGIVWESLEDVDGAECAFFDGALRPSSVRGGDWLGADGGGPMGETGIREAVEPGAADAALAQQLQAEEDAHEQRLVERARAREPATHHPHAQPPTSASAPSALPAQATVTAAGADGGDAGAGRGRAAKKLSRVARGTGGEGKAEKDKCMVM